MKEIKGRWIIIIPTILYGLFMFWSYYPIILYAILGVFGTGMFIVYNCIIYSEYYKPYRREDRYFKRYYKTSDTYGYDIKKSEVDILKLNYDKVKYYYIGFWYKKLYNYTLVPISNALAWCSNSFVNICMYIDKSLTIKI